MKLKFPPVVPLEKCFSLVSFLAKVSFWPKTMDYSQGLRPKFRRFFAICLLLTGMLYKAKNPPSPPSSTGTHTQMFPVKVMCGQRCGLHMTATTAMPEAVRTGLALSLGRRALRWEGGTAAMMSTRRGWLERPWRLATWPLSLEGGGEGGREGGREELLIVGHKHTHTHTHTDTLPSTPKTTKLRRPSLLCHLQEGN